MIETDEKYMNTDQIMATRKIVESLEYIYIARGLDGEEPLNWEWGKKSFCASLRFLRSWRFRRFLRFFALFALFAMVGLTTIGVRLNRY